MKRNVIYILVTFLFVISCNGDEKEKIRVTKQYVQDTILVFEEYDASGKLQLLKQLSLDSSNNNGYQIQYGENGKIKKWLWFNKNERYPEVIIYYDSLGNYESFKGTPFLKAGTRNNKRIIQVVNPPKVKYILGYREFKDGVILKQQAYQPGIGMGRGWMTIEGHLFEKGHQYFVYYYILNSNNKIADSAFVELAP